MLESIILMSCRSPFLDDAKIYAPMANMYLKSYMNKYKPHVNVVLGDDSYDLEHPEKFESFDAIGISIMTPQREEALNLLKIIKSKYPKKTVIAGGPHCKYYFKEIENEPWDYIVPLDGERAIIQIIDGGKQRIISDIMSKQDINEQPRPDRSSETAIRMLNNYHYTINGRNAATMMTARGCPEQCTFCEEAMSVVKWSNQENLEAEMNDIKNLGYGGVYIFDDLFAIAMPKVKPICRALSRRDLIYRCNGQVRYFTKWGDEFAKLLSSTGCYEIAFGFESGNQTILDNVKKRTTVEMNYKATEYAKMQGLRVKAFLMIGLPGETMETIADTEKFIATSGIDDFQLSIFYPYKGTAIRDAIDKGQNSVDLMFIGEGLGAYGQKGGSTESVIRTSCLSAEQLLTERDRIVKKYKPKAHQQKWKDEDKFFQTHEITKVDGFEV